MREMEGITLRMCKVMMRFLVVLILFLFCGCKDDFFYREELGNEVATEVEFVGLLLEEVKEYEGDYDFEYVYEYSSEVKVGVVISQEMLGIYYYKLVVSKGDVPVAVYEEYRVNELGKVPIMMYHGIIDMMSSETKYVGGNVDRDGYQRTSEAFREDLEFYYQEGYRMMRLIDYVEGKIDVELGRSPIVLTFDDGAENNFRVLGEENGELVIDPNCAVGILEEFKNKYPDYGVTATFFVNQGLFEQEEYNLKILKWLVSHGYDIGNHTMNHVDFTEVGLEETIEEVGGMYQILDDILSGDYVPIVALPFGSPYRLEHANFGVIMAGVYGSYEYKTKAALRVGWEAEVSCFDESFNSQFLKRIRAYDNKGEDFDIEYNFRLLEDTRYISDGDKDTVVVPENLKDMVGDIDKRVRVY